MGGNVGIGDSTPDGILDIEYAQTSGTLLSISAPSSVTLSGTLIGQAIDLSTNITSAGRSVTGQTIALPALTVTTGVRYQTGISISSGALALSGGLSATNYGINITNPGVTDASAIGINVVTGSITTSGQQTGLSVSASGVSVGPLFGLDISAITAGAGTENAIAIGTGWDKMLDTGSIDISGTGAVTDATSYNGLVITANTGVITTGTWNATAITSTYLDTAVILSTEIDTSSELAAILTDETGTGALVFGTSPTFTTALTAPLIYGGSAAGSGLTLQSTSGAGSTDFIKFLVGNAGATESMRILSNGKVGIASSTPWRTLSVVGTVALNGLSAVAGTDNSVCIDPTTFEITTQAGDTCAVSAARYKHDINPLQNGDGGLAMLKQLNAVSYKYNNDTTNTKYWGLIADQAASTSPQLAYFNPDGSVQTLNTFGFLALFTKSIQELNLNLETIASTTGSSTVQSRLFATSFFERVGQWLGETTNGIKQLYAEKVETKELCVGSVCVDEETFLKMVESADVTAAPASGGGIEEVPPSEPIPPPDPDPVPNPEPLPLPEPLAPSDPITESQ